MRRRKALAARGGSRRAPNLALVGVFVALVPLDGCHRKSDGKDAPAEAPSAASSGSLVSPARAETSLATVADAVALSDLRFEARRGTATHPEPLLDAERAVLEKHFGGAAFYPLAFQVVSAGMGRHAVLLSRTEGDARPFVFLFEDGGNVVWTKEHPIGGVKPGVSEPSLASGPDGHTCLAWCNASTDSVALRRWAEDGSAFADYDVLHVDACDALSIAYFPRHGWVIAVAGPGGATLELVSENGELVWGRDGVTLPWTWHGPAPLSLAFDTADSLLVFRLGQSGGAGSGEYVFASRWGADGRPIWPGPLSLKRLDAKVEDPRARLLLTPGPDGAVRATLPGAALENGHDVVVEVASDGVVTRR
jgi:hypothetical protein